MMKTEYTENERLHAGDIMTYPKRTSLCTQYD